MNTHIIILGLIIVLIGSLAGLVNFLNYYFKKLVTNNYEVIRHILSGIGASILVPLLLNMLSSDLINYNESYNDINYFVFAGFCFIAGYFSDRFINSIGEKILKDLEQTKSKVTKIMNEKEENEEKLDILISNESDIDDETIDAPIIDLSNFRASEKFKNENVQAYLHNIINAMKGRYKFRTSRGLAKELRYPENNVKIVLEVLENEGAVRRFTGKDGKTLWALTKIGQLIKEK